MDNGLYFNNTINTKLPERWLRAVNFLIDVNMTATHHLSRIEVLSMTSYTFSFFVLMWTAIFLIQNLDFSILAFDTQEQVVMETKTGTNKCMTENRVNTLNRITHMHFDFTTPKGLNLHSKRWKNRKQKPKREGERRASKEDKILDRKTLIFLFYLYIVYFREKTLE